MGRFGFFTEVLSNVSEPNDAFTGPKVGKTLVNVVRSTLVHSLLRPTVDSVLSADIYKEGGGVQRGI